MRPEFADLFELVVLDEMDELDEFEGTGGVVVELVEVLAPHVQQIQYYSAVLTPIEAQSNAFWLELTECLLEDRASSRYFVYQLVFIQNALFHLLR